MGLSFACFQPCLAFLANLLRSLLFRQAEKHLGDATESSGAGPAESNDLCVDELGIPSYLELLRVNGEDAMALSLPHE
jgi:hypothetical protein